jgi:hypothetical protein
MNVAFGSMIAYSHPVPKRPTTVRSGHLLQNSELPYRVVSRRLAKSYIKLVSTSEFGTTTDIRQAPGQEHVIDSVLLRSANCCRSRPANSSHAFGQNLSFAELKFAGFLLQNLYIKNGDQNRRSFNAKLILLIPSSCAV